MFLKEFVEAISLYGMSPMTSDYLENSYIPFLKQLKDKLQLENSDSLTSTKILVRSTPYQITVYFSINI